MNFNFPEFIDVNYKGVINIDEEQPFNNTISIDNVDYIFRKLTPFGNKGGHSIILKLYRDVEIETIGDYNDLEEVRPDFILKIHKTRVNFLLDNPNFNDLHKRFLNEISALRKCKEKLFSNIIDIEHSGFCKINSKFYLYYVMEFAESDLKQFIEEHHSSLTYEYKLNLCTEILDGIKQLQILNLYHRDIKPDNIFISNNSWKIGDLGLIGGRDLDFVDLDRDSEFIGPRGWSSPEVLNKYLTESKSYKNDFDCNIDHQSDIFQLGKLFWYIFQHNAPIGNIKVSDFDSEFSEVYPIIRTMLNHCKKKRYKDVEEIIILFKKLHYKLIKTS